MKARLRIYTNQNKEYFNELFSQTNTMCGLVKDGVLNIEDIELVNATYEVKKGISTFGNIEIETLNEKNYQVRNKVYPEIDSFDILSQILNIGHGIEKCVKYEKDINGIENNLSLNRIDFYKIAIKNMLSRSKNLIGFCLPIFKLMKNYGSISTVKNVELEGFEDDSQRCNVLTFLLICYLMYESCYLIDYTKQYREPKLSLYYYYNKGKNPNRNDVFSYVNEQLIYLDKNTSRKYKYESEFDKENERWKTSLIFDDVLALAVYELRIQLSDDGETSVGICKNIACGKTFVRKTKKREYCENIECHFSRQNQRKKKSLENPKNISLKHTIKNKNAK